MSSCWRASSRVASSGMKSMRTVLTGAGTAPPGVDALELDHGVRFELGDLVGAGAVDQRAGRADLAVVGLDELLGRDPKGVGGAGSPLEGDVGGVQGDRHLVVGRLVDRLGVRPVVGDVRGDLLVLGHADRVDDIVDRDRHPVAEHGVIAQRVDVGRWRGLLPTLGQCRLKDADAVRSHEPLADQRRHVVVDDPGLFARVQVRERGGEADGEGVDLLGDGVGR